MATAVRARIIAMQDTFTHGEFLISNYILEHFNEIQNESITVLANKVDTSDASINRFCKKIGYKGFYSFKIAIAQESYYRESVLKTPTNDNENTVTKIVSSYRELLNHAKTLLDDVSLVQISEYISNANMVYILCNESTKLVANELNNRLSAIGIRSILLDSFIKMNVTSFDIKKGEVCICFLSNVLSKDYFNALLTIKNNGAKIALVTNFFSKESKSISDCVVFVVDKMLEKYANMISNNLMYLLVIDAMMMNLMLKNKGYRERKHISDTLENQQKFGDTFYFNL